MSEANQKRADRLFDEALEDAGTRDPRGFYREQLRELKGRDPAKYEEAVEYYSEVLLPSIVEEGRDPITAWQEYGARLAQWTNPGRPVEIDSSGRSHPHEPPAREDRMVLHLPDGKGWSTVIALPRQPSSAQRATYDLMVEGKKQWTGDDE